MLDSLTPRTIKLDLITPQAKARNCSLRAFIIKLLLSFYHVREIICNLSLSLNQFFISTVYIELQISMIWQKYRKYRFSIIGSLTEIESFCFITTLSLRYIEFFQHFSEEYFHQRLLSNR